VIGAILIGVLIWWFVRRRSKRKASDV
jgi:plastocyanin domain-containing protein